MLRLASALLILAAPVFVPAPAKAEVPAKPQATLPALAQPVGTVEVPRLGMSVRNFILVAGAPVEGSPAAKAGFVPNDIVLGLGGRALPSGSAFIEAIRALPPRSTVQVRVRRGRQMVDVAATLDGWAESATAPPATRGRLGLPIRDIVVVQKVEAGSVSDRMGLAGGEVLRALDARVVESAGAFAQWVAQAPEGRAMLLGFERGRGRYGARVAPDGTVEAVPVDTVLAESSRMRAASSLAEEARRDAASAARLRGQKLDVVGVVRRVMALGKEVVVFLDNSDSQNRRSGDTIAASFKPGPLADAVRGLKPGDSLRFRAVVSGAKQQQEEDPDYTSSDAFLDHVPGTPAPKADTITTVDLDFEAEALLGQKDE